MKLDKLRYDVTIAIASYGVNDHIGAEGLIEEGETPMEAFLKLKSEVDAMARIAYPHLYANGSKVKFTTETLEIPAIPRLKEQDLPKDDFSLLDKIKNSDNVKELKSWNILIQVKKGEEKSVLLKEYDKKMVELNKKETA